MLSTIGLLKIR